MDLFLLSLLALAAFWIAKSRLQHQRIAFLASYLSRYQLEKHIETLTQGYLRALGEGDAARREQVWAVLQGSEQALCRQVTQLAADLDAADPAGTRVSKLPFWLPFASALAPSFDLREAMRVQARGICQAVASDAAPRDRAFAISAELFLLQHTCHWFCRSKWVASARMAALHKTSYRQVVDAVMPQTRNAYLSVVA